MIADNLQNIFNNKIKRLDLKTSSEDYYLQYLNYYIT